MTIVTDSKPIVPPHVTRRLAAVAFADVAGFSALMEQDDVATMARWKSLRTEIIEPKLAEYRGRLIRIIGDGLFVEFQSAVDAVRWAIDVQSALLGHSEHGPGALKLRIGVNVEDVIIDEDDLHGDGVNIAARIQQIANPGEVVMTAAVREYVWNKLGVALVDLGERSLKNLSRPIRLYAVDRRKSEHMSLAGYAHGLPPHVGWSNRPSIAVMPFRNLGGTPNEDYFGEGMTEEIISALSRSRSMYVIARASTLSYRNRISETKQIASELGVKYILDGTVRREEQRLRISVELIDAARNHRVWGERYDGVAASLFDFQDRIASSIVATLEPKLVEVETTQARQKPTENLDAYDCVLRALSLFYTFEKAEFRQAGDYLDRAIVLDPTYAQAYAYKAWWYVFRMAEGLLQEDEESTRHAAEQAVRRAMALDDQDAFVVAVAGHVESLIHKQPELALELFDRALVLNENSAFAWGMSAASYAYLGESEPALERLRSAWRLSPFDPLNFVFYTLAGIAEFVAGRYDPAIVWLRKAKREKPRFVATLRTLCACLSAAGRVDDARIVARELLDVEPNFSVRSIESWYPFRRADDLARYVAGLRAAGLPE